ncbi:succinylglutamate desuccinylase/aspartoacylase family protein [Flagellimonas sp.]|uniref:succinylglutamate desuccinylase/aspartoacylase family protein n=1 Tax=Flagellimonas sp. TaxID=2058762 RepID=UPI003B5050A0
MRTIHVLFAILLIPCITWSQTDFKSIEELELEKVAPQTKTKFWLKMIDNGMSRPVEVPVIVVKGKKAGPVLCLTAALHGNELNGIRVIQEVVDHIDLSNFNGTLVAIPGLNAISITQHQRRYIDQEDLNRNFPGKEKGNRSQQYVWQIKEKILSKIDYLVDMHTASFGRVNTLYVRAAMGDEKIAQMARLQDADIILNSNGRPSANEQISATRTMRAEAMLRGVPSITIEYGNPQVFQPELIARGKKGIENLMAWLQMTEMEIQTVTAPTLCKKSYWIYVEEGGYLEVLVQLNQKLKKGDSIAVMRNPFGDVIHQYYCPEDGIVIGKSSNPINMNGGRIIHLGILDESGN